MKKITLVTAAAVAALAAQAQYNVSPSTATVLEKGPLATLDYVTLSEGAIAEFEKAGVKVNYIGPDAEAGRNLWYWDNTFVPGDESMPRVDMEEGGYISVEVSGAAAWSGAGVAIDAPGIDISHFDDNTIFHIGYMTPSGNGPASVALILLDNTAGGSKPAKVALGDPFNDNGAVYPAIGAKINDEWQGVELSLGTLKKIYPAFDLQGKSAWNGNLFCWLGGAVKGQTMAFDAVYFYNTGENGLDAVNVANKGQFVVTSKTVNVAGGNGIVLYNIAGQAVRSTEGTTLGLNGLGKGIYVAKSGKEARKIVIR